jgi:hypothetical protein
MDSFYYLPKELNNRNEEAMHATEEASYWFRAFALKKQGARLQRSRPTRSTAHG